MTFALVDCNNFYASCERSFNPHLEGQPIVVLSNNDGCVIARSNEAKVMGIPMGAPFYKVKPLYQARRLHVFSSNYSLYGDMSDRVMNTIERVCPEMEVYSIDEAFLNLSAFAHHNLLALGHQLRLTVKQWTGIPVSVGLGPTKTLAKIANHIAKKHVRSGIFDISHEISRKQWLKKIAVGEIWGIGRRLNEKLQALGIHTAHDLSICDPKWLRKKFSVVVERTARELNACPCLPMESVTARKNILTSRSFGKPQTKQETIAEALSDYTATASEKMRKQKCRASGMTVFLYTNPFRQRDKQYRNSFTLHFPAPTADTRALIKYAKHCLTQIYKSGYRYHKAGVLLFDLVPYRLQQQHLLDPTANHNPKAHRLMKTLDYINQTLGRKKVFMAAQGMEEEWQMQQQYRSNRYTTQWQELPKAG